MAKVGPQNPTISTELFCIGQRQIPRPAAQIQDRPAASRRHSTHRLPAPVFINPKRQEMVQKIVSRGDFAEHLADAAGGFIDGHRHPTISICGVHLGRRK
jgi:hypothetical protein